MTDKPGAKAAQAVKERAAQFVTPDEKQKVADLIKRHRETIDESAKR